MGSKVLSVPNFSKQPKLVYNIDSYTHPSNVTESQDLDLTVYIDWKYDVPGTEAVMRVRFYIDVYVTSLSANAGSYNQGTLVIEAFNGRISDSSSLLINPGNYIDRFPKDSTLQILLTVRDVNHTEMYGQVWIPCNYSNWSALKPTFTVNNPVVDNSNDSYKTPDSWGITQSLSLMKFGYSYALKKNATFKSIVCKEGTATIATTRDTTNHTLNTTTPTTKSGSLTYAITLTDSRGIATTVNKTFTVNAYSNPIVPTVTANRCLADGTIDEDGTYILLNATYEANNLQSNEFTSILGAIKRAENDEYITVNHPLTWKMTTSSGSTIKAESSDVLGDGKIGVDEEFIVAASVFDKPGSLNHKWTSKSTHVYKSYCTMDFLAGGKGIAFGTTASKEGFECNMDADFNKTVNVDGNLTVKGGSQVEGTANFQGAVYVNNGPMGVNGTLDINGVSRYPNNHQVYEGGGRKHLRLYPAGSENKTYRIATTGKQTGGDLDSHMTLLVSGHCYVNEFQDYTGILNVVFRHYGENKYASVVWLANNGWPVDAFKLKVGGTNGNMFADLWYESPNIYVGLHVTVLDGGSRGSRQFDLLQLRFDNISGGSYSSIPASNPDGLGAYTSTHTAVSSAAGLCTVGGNGYWGLTLPDRKNGGLLRAPSEGFIPSIPGGYGTLGTSSWPFKSVYTHHLYMGAANATEQVKDIIVATGNTDPWKWRKYASGYAECEAWFNKSVPNMTTDNWHWISTSNSITFSNYPFNFISDPVVTITAINNNQLWCVNGSGGSKSTPPQVFAISAQAYSGNCNFNVRARGYWRAENFNRI